jgi:hypothetical protein
VVGDPYACLLALGACRLPDVIESYIGTGKDAYIVFTTTPEHPFPHAELFTLPAKACRARDAFDTDADLQTQLITLHAPTAARTLAAREKLNTRRKQELRDGNGKPFRPRSRSRAEVIIRRQEMVLAAAMAAVKERGAAVAQAKAEVKVAPTSPKAKIAETKFTRAATEYAAAQTKVADIRKRVTELKRLASKLPDRQNVSRFQRLGVFHRPRAPISEAA